MQRMKYVLLFEWLLASTALLGTAGCSHVEFPQITEVNQILIGDDIGTQFQWSPDGKYVAYIRDKKAVIVSHLETSYSQIISPVESNFLVFEPRWSPDSTMLSYRLHDESEPCFTGEKAHNLKAAPSYSRKDYMFVFHNETTWLFDTDMSRSYQEDDKLISTNRQVKRRLLGAGICTRTIIYHLATGESQIFLAGTYNWSPDGNWLAGGAIIGDTYQFVVVRVSDGTIVYQNRSARILVVTTDALPYHQFVWSPNGRYIVYAVDDEDNPDQARLVDIEARTQIVIEAANSEHYVWSQDSKQLVYFKVESLSGTDQQGGLLNVNLYSIATQTTRLLTQIHLPNYRYGWPTWSPDDQYLSMIIGTEANALEAQERGVRDLVLIDVQSGEFSSYPIVEVIRSVQWIRWGQDSQRIYLSGDSEILEVIFSNR